MPEIINLPKEEWERLQERARKLAQEKSYLQLVNDLMIRLSEVPGLASTVEAILRLIVDHLGGAQVALYYPVASQIHYADVLGGRQVLDAVDDPMVRHAFERREFAEEQRGFADTKMMTPAFTKASSWALPLMVGDQLVGVLKTEGMLMAAAEIRAQLQPFFHYAALVLKNEVESHVKHLAAAQLAAIVQSSDDAIIGKTLEGVITSWNQGAERIYGYTEREMVGRSITLLAPPGREDEAPRMLARLRAGEHIEHFETVRRRKDGRDIHASLTISPIKDAAGHLVGASTIARDITARKQAEEELRRINRALRMLSDSNQALIRTTDETTLLNEICQTIVGVGGYRLAWVGFAEHDGQKTVRTAAQAGYEAGYLEAMEITWADEPHGRGPTGTAIRTGQIFIARDIHHNPACVPWQEAARQQGFQSSVALPLASDGQTFGALSIYAAEAGAFDAQELEILKELAGDLAFGIAARRTQLACEQAERRMTLMDFALNHVLEAAMLTDEEGRFHYVNDRACRTLGYRRDELLTLRVTDIDPDFPAARWAEHWRELKAKGALLFEGCHRTKEGRAYPVEIAANYFEYDGRAYNLGLIRDITERKRAEEALRASEAGLREAQQLAHVGSWNLDLIHNRLDWSEEIYRIFELDPAGFGASYEAFLEKVHPDDRERVNRAYTESVRDRTPYDIEHRLLLPEGRVKFVHERCRTLYDAEGRALRSNGTVQDITERKRAEQERLAHLRLLEGLDQVNRAIQGTSDLEQMMSNVLAVVLSIYDCDRAWLLHPCDPEAPSFRVPMEITRPEYPGAKVLNVDVPLAPSEAQSMREALASDGPVTYTAGTDRPVATAQQFAVQSQMFVPLRTKLGKPWLLGLHQCSRPRVWTPEEKQLLQEIGRRLTDALTSLLAARELRESEERYRLVFEHSPVSIGEEDYSGVKALFDDLRQAGVTDIETHFDQHPDTVRQCAELVRFVDANQAALALHAAANKEDLLAGLSRTFTPEAFEVFRQGLVCLWNGGTHLCRDAVVKTLTGELRHVTVYFSVCPGYERTLSKVLISLADITERKQADEALRASEARYRTLVESSPYCIHEIDAQGRLSTMNQAGLGMMGVRDESAIRGMPYLAAVADADKERIGRLLDLALQGQPSDFDFTAANGQCFHSSFVPIKDGHGAVLRLMGLTQDITEREQAEEALAAKHRELQEAAQQLEQSRNMLQLILESIPVRVFWKDRDLRYLGGNRLFARDAGLSHPEQLLGKDDFALAWRDQAELYRADDRQVMESRRPKLDIVEPQTTPEGATLWLNTSKVPLAAPGGEIFGVLGVYQDVTEHKRAEELLHAREEEFRALVENASDAIVRYDRAGRRKYVNPVFAQLAGQPADQLIGKTPVETYVGNPEVGTRSLAAIQRVLREAAPVEIEATWKDDAGALHCFQNRFTPEFDRAGTVASVLSVARDITALKLTEEQLRKLSRAVEQSPASIVITDTAGNIEYVNPRFAEVTGYGQVEAIGKNPRILKSGETPVAQYEQLWRTITAGKEWRGEFRNRKKSGELYWETASISPIFDAAGAITHYLAVKEDVTEHKHLEEEFRQAQKMEAFGQLAGGVAHDFNNLLTVIGGNVTLAQMSEPGTAELENALDEIARAAERAANLTRQLLMFSRRRVVQLKNLDLNEVVGNMTKMLQRLIGEHISLAAHYAPGGAPVHADPGMLEQVLMNLAVNSRDAMPKGGRLRVKTELVLVDENAVRANPRGRPGSFVRLSVSDAGVGIAPEVLPRIFEPFFTTKGVGKGTGLGLATVFGIVEQHDGWIEVESQVGVGTTFHVYLPRAEGGAEAKAGRSAISTEPGGTETILLVEDEPAVQFLARKVLEQHGYRILVAASGPEALRIWAERKADIDLLFTDMVMPEGMSGRELAERLQAERPNLKVIFSSGYTDEMLEEGSTLRGAPNFLQKPYSQVELLRKARACLDAR